MSYVPGYEWDIFLSYAHNNNTTVPGDPGARWVDSFQEQLRINLKDRDRSISLWWDKRIDEGHTFNTMIREAVESSAVFLVLTSGSQLQSDYCREELRMFYEKSSKEGNFLLRNNRKRIINVRLTDEPFEKWPKEYHASRDEEAEGFRFFKEGVGRPMELFTETFRDRIWTLVLALEDTLGAMKIQPRLVMAPGKPEVEPAEHSKFDVFLANTAPTRSMRADRNWLVQRLEHESISVFEKVGTEDEPARKQIPPPWPPEHDDAVKSALEDSLMSIHILDEELGTPSGEGDTYPIRQLDLALNHGNHPIIWVPDRVKLDIASSVDDQENRYFELLRQLKSGTVRRERGSYSFVHNTLDELLEAIKAKQDALKMAAEAEDHTAAFVDLHRIDSRWAASLTSNLRDMGVEYLVNRHDDDPRKMNAANSERLKHCDAVVFVYGDVGEDHIKNRMEVLTKQVITQENVKLFLYVAPPSKDSQEVDRVRPGQLKSLIGLLDNSDGFDPGHLSPLYHHLKVA